jgi:P4 family phage/plasmid primase-like protien
MSAGPVDDAVIAVTFFRDYAAATKREERLDLHDLGRRIANAGAPVKDRLPWLKLARFGDIKTPLVQKPDGKWTGGSLRHNENVQFISGVEADYDGERISLDDALDTLRQAGVLALVYTSPSHIEDTPRWRVLCPFSVELPPTERSRQLARLNGLFGGAFSTESWTLSQSYYFGAVNRNPSHRVELIDGTPIDQMHELDAGAIGKAGRVNGAERPINSTGGPSAPPSDARLEGFRLSVLDDLRRQAVDGQKHIALRNAALRLGGIQAEVGFTDAEAVQWLLDALPESVEDWNAARATARWGLENGRLRPIELGDRPRSNGRCAPPPPFPDAASAQYRSEPDDDAGFVGAEQADAVGGEETRTDARPDPPPHPGDHAAGAGLITEGSVADAFAREHRDRLRYDHHVGKWFLWDDTRWKREETKLAYRWAHQKAKKLAADTDNAKAMLGAGKATFAGGVERLAQCDRAFAVTSEIWDPDPWLLGTPGGAVDLRSGRLRPATQADYITKLAAVTPTGTTLCPRWLTFLHEAAGGDAALIRFLQQWCGYCLTGSIEEHALLFVYGDGGNGKSVFINTISGILADYCRTAPMDTFTASKNDRHPTDLAMLRGARLVTTTETEEGHAWAEARIKQLTGGDRISARFMRQDFFEFTPQFKLTVIGNHVPELHNVDAAARRRINMAPFTHKPPVVDKKLEEKLRTEWPDILRWMIDGCLDWQANSLIRPPVVADSTAEYFSEQDLLAQWIEDCCERTDEDGVPARDTLGSLLASWRNYAKGRGDEPGSSKGFGMAMRARGFTPIRNQYGIRGRGFRGIRVRVQQYDPIPGYAR